MTKSVFKEAAELGAAATVRYFRASKSGRDKEAAVLGIKAVGNFRGLMAAESNRATVQLKAAKAIGLQGEALASVLEEVSGRTDGTLLPSVNKPTRKARARR
jgi:hypothetical protein